MTGHTFTAIAEALLSQQFVFAKTMPQIPHYYVVRAKWEHAISFDDVVFYIREHGYTDNWGTRTFHYLNLNGQRYWTMGAPVGETIVLNRAVIPRSKRASYDEVAEQYDAIYDEAKFQEENNRVFEYVPVEVASLLDIGCGTGLALDYIAPERYVGFDPSYAMLDRITQKFGKLGEGFSTFKAGMEEFHTVERFDYVLCLFGVANYLPAEQVKRIPSYVAQGGTYLVMLQNEGYVPVVHDANPKVKQTYWHHPPDLLSGDRIDTGNGYTLIVGERPAIRKRVRVV
jgi:SAM-dependent methyltransferase